MWVSFAEIIESGDDLFPRQLVKLVDVVLFPPVYGQATESRPDLLRIDGGRKLTRLFCPARQFVEAFELADKGHAVFPLSLFPQFFDQISDQRVGRTIQQFVCVLLGGVGRVASQPSALGITVSPLDVVPSKLSLPVGQASGLLWQGKPPIGFSVGFCFLQSKGSRERICSLCSGTNGTKWDGNSLIKTTLVPLVPLVPPFLKIFFQKLFRVEKAIGANTLNIFSCVTWDNMRRSNHWYCLPCTDSLSRVREPRNLTSFIADVSTGDVCLSSIMQYCMGLYRFKDRGSSFTEERSYV